MPECHDSARIGHVFPVSQRNVFIGKGLGAFFHRHGFSGHGRFLNAHVYRLGDPDIGRDYVSHFQFHQIARYDIFHIHDHGLSVSDHLGHRCCHFLQRLKRLLRLEFLICSDECIQEQDTHYNIGVEQSFPCLDAHHAGNYCGDDEQYDHETLEL